MRRIIIASIYLPVYIILGSIVFNTILKYNSSDLLYFVSGNVLLDSNFNEGFKYWGHDNGITITNINSKRYVSSKIDKSRKQFYQDISVVSGKVYRLKFTLKGNQSGAFAIYRDSLTGDEEYLFCNGNKKSQKYLWDIKSIRTGKNTIYFTMNQIGDYLFSDIQLLDSDIIDREKVIKASLIIAIVAITLEIFTFLLFSNYFFITFILICFIIPILKVNKEFSSDKEKRKLATFKPIMKNNNINTSFGKDFNDYLNDRFFGRSLLITGFGDFRYILDGRCENNKAIQGKNGWLFEKFNNDHFLPSYNTDKAIANNMLNYQNIFNKLGIRTYFASIPEKSSVYGEYNLYKFTEEKLSNVLSQSDKYKFIFMLDKFLAEKNNGLLYFKDDHHWTERGAYFYAKELIDRCKEFFPELDVIDAANFKISKIKNTYYTSIVQPVFYERKNYTGSIRYLLNLDDDKYNYTSFYDTYRHKKYSIPKTIFSKTLPYYSKYINNEINNKLKITVIGDSNISFLIPFLTSSFNECVFIQINQDGNYGWSINKYLNVIESNIPDVVLIITRSENIKSWMFFDKQ